MSKSYNNGEIPYIIYSKNVIVFPEIMLYGFFIIYTFVKVKSFRKKPGDFFIMIAINDIFLGSF